MRTLHTERLELVPLDPDRDAPSLHRMLADPRMYEYSTEHPTRTVEQTRTRLADWLAGNGGWTWAIRLRGEPDAVGTIGLFYDQGTSIRGIDRNLRPDLWGRGLMTEAARAAVDSLLEQPGIDGVQAWIDSGNLRSLGVARRAGLAQVGRLPRVYDDRVAQQIVMARAAEPADPDTLGIRAVLPVRDVEATTAVLTRVLGLWVAFSLGEPAELADLAIERWSGSPGVRLRRVGSQAYVCPGEIAVDLGIDVDRGLARAVDAGLEIASGVEDKPWYRREFVFGLPEGHRVVVSGPLRPAYAGEAGIDEPSQGG